MAGDWMKIEKITPQKPEIEAMADILGIDPDAVFGKLFRIWSWFDDQTLNGNAPCVTLALLDRYSCVTGFGKAMEKVGWLEANDAGLTLPNFDRHNGETAKRRALTAKRVAECKRKKGNASSVTLALPREEKRREELKEKIPKKVSKEKFTPPTVEEVQAYCHEKSYRIDAEYFVAYYAKSGWKLTNGQAMKDWQAAIVTWVKNQKKFESEKKGKTSRVMDQLFGDRK